jgi:hypothetical protein
VTGDLREWVNIDGGIEILPVSGRMVRKNLDLMEIGGETGLLLFYFSVLSSK